MATTVTKTDAQAATHREFRAFGPPGCGKTTWISRQVERALMKHQPDEIFCVSFTRAAAVELAGRDTGLPRGNVGTIHSICYHSLGCPPLMEVEKHLREEWNEMHPRWEIDGNGEVDEPPADMSLLQAYNRRRAQLRDRPDRKEQAHLRDRFAELQPFINAWEEFKSDHGAYDFTDLLLDAPASIGATVLFVDEAQDLTPLQWRVVRRWGGQAETFVVAGDDDQLLYNFLGASADAFLTPLPEDRIRILGRSYRLPRAVYQYAERWISKLAGRRQEKKYQPRDVQGLVERRGLKLGQPGPLCSEIADRVADGQNVMVLASCGYMLHELIGELRSRGIPFHNPYRRKRGDWNPLKTTGRRLLAFLRCARAAQEDRLQPIGDWWAWMKMLRAKDALQHGAKAEIARKARAEEHLRWEDLENWVTVPLLDALLETDLQWLADNTTQRFAKAVEYPLRIYTACGEHSLKQEPRLIIGTIHSVKGGEADVVYLFPDISFQAYREATTHGQAARDALTRMAYVGMTRARRELHLGQPTGKHYVKWI